MKKICIVTCYKTSNFGSRLQAVSLSMAIEKLGYDPYFLRTFKARGFMLRHPRMIYARICKKLTKNVGKQFFTPVPYQMGPERKARLDKFTVDHYREMEINSDDDWKRVISERIPFVAGSDIIWNPAFGYPAYYFLDYACYAKLPCLSYASSIGSLELPKKYYGAYRRYLGWYKGIGVREYATIDLLSEIIDRPLTKVVDPTLLLTREEWDTFADRAEYSEKIEEKFIFCYFVMHDERYWEYVKKVHEATGLQIVILPMHYLDEQQPYTVIKDGTPYEFVDLIRKAEFIVTDSFHTCSFALTYQKEFYLLRRTRKAEDAKFDNFLDRYGLSDRTVSDENSFVRNYDTDYTSAHERLIEDRQSSLEFLSDTLSSANG